MKPLPRTRNVSRTWHARRLPAATRHQVDGRAAHQRVEGIGPVRAAEQAVAKMREAVERRSTSWWIVMHALHRPWDCSSPRHWSPIGSTFSKSPAGPNPSMRWRASRRPSRRQ